MGFLDCVASTSCRAASSASTHRELDTGGSVCAGVCECDCLAARCPKGALKQDDRRQGIGNNGHSCLLGQVCLEQHVGGACTCQSILHQVIDCIALQECGHLQSRALCDSNRRANQHHTALNVSFAQCKGGVLACKLKPASWLSLLQHGCLCSSVYCGLSIIG